MGDPDVHDIERVITDRLSDHELTGRAFDPRLIAPDYGDRLEMDASLDALIGVGDTGVSSDPTDPA